jgi:peptide/nickel transport system ATP-binding protein
VLRAEGVDKKFDEPNFVEQMLGRERRFVHAVDHVSIKVNARSTLGLVGESGSGKTTLARAIVALGRADEGELTLLGEPISLDIRKRDRETLRNLRMVFQNPNDALNPFRTVGETIGRTIRKLSSRRWDASEVRSRVIELLEAVGMTAEYYNRYPRYLSGGEKQRVAIARAFAAAPAFVVADEPTSSLDVSVQAVILNLLKDLRATQGASYLVISHDLEVVGYLADWIVVMYLGEVMEQGTNEHVHQPPYHPYTEALLSAAPVADPSRARDHITLEGEIPSPRNKPSGCPFHTRCPRFIGDICINEEPPIRETEDGHQIVCHHPLDELKEMQS